jgi:hypothetical protein
MRQHHATEAPKLTRALLRAGYIVVIAALVLRNGFNFTPVTNLENFPFAIALVLLIPVAMSYAFLQSRHRAPENLVAFRFGMPGLAMAAVACAIWLSSGILGWPSAFPAFIVILALVLAWLSVAFLAISNLLLLFALASFLLSHLHASA